MLDVAIERQENPGLRVGWAMAHQAHSAAPAGLSVGWAMAHPAHPAAPVPGTDDVLIKLQLSLCAIMAS